MRMNKSITYTEAEQDLIDLLKKKKGKPLDTLEILEHHYPSKDRPLFARESLVVTLATIIKKSKLRKDDFKICKSKRRGPHPCEHRVE